MHHPTVLSILQDAELSPDDIQYIKDSEAALLDSEKGPIFTRALEFLFDADILTTKHIDELIKHRKFLLTEGTGPLWFNIPAAFRTQATWKTILVLCEKEAEFGEVVTGVGKLITTRKEPNTFFTPYLPYLEGLTLREKRVLKNALKEGVLTQADLADMEVSVISQLAQPIVIEALKTGKICLNSLKQLDANGVNSSIFESLKKADVTGLYPANDTQGSPSGYQPRFN